MLYDAVRKHPTVKTSLLKS
ncbi:hypothetical protein PO124_03590 [Bacillus licheniformis]|nr:hypothetical protein [Bacillus licheniformis]